MGPAIIPIKALKNLQLSIGAKSFISFAIWEIKEQTGSHKPCILGFMPKVAINLDSPDT